MPYIDIRLHGEHSNRSCTLGWVDGGMCARGGDFIFPHLYVTLPLLISLAVHAMPPGNSFL